MSPPPIKLPSLLALLCLTLALVPLSAAEKIDDFLGLKFGANPAAAKKEMQARGIKLKAEKSDVMTFSGGTYAGEPISELELRFAGDAFAAATVSVKYSVDKSEEKGLAFYESMRKSLTEKYGTPVKVPSIAHGKNFAEKAKENALETVWETKDALKRERRTITLTVPGIGYYSWTFKVVYEDEAAAGKAGAAAPRKDI